VAAAQTPRRNAPEGPGAIEPGIAVVDPEGRFLYSSSTAQRITEDAVRRIGRRLDQIEALKGTGIVEAFERVGRERKSLALRSVRLRAPSSESDLVLDIDLIPLLDRDEIVRQVVILFADVTRDPWYQRRAALFFQAFMHSSNAIELTDRRGVYIDVNPAFERIYGWRREEVIGQKPRLIASPKTPPETYTAMWRDITNPAKGEWSGEIVNVDRSGREHPVLLSVSAIRSEEGEASQFIGVATDLSDLKRLQLQSIHAERLATLGQLSAGIAHELNTPLANIMLIAESLHRRSPSPWVTGRAEAISRQVEAASRIVAGLLDFGRSHPAVMHDADLVSIIHETVEFLRGKQSPDVDLVEENETLPLPVRVNRVEIIQVLANLANNAYDAMEGQGRLWFHSRATGEWAEVSVRDSGPGIPANVMPHLFEPFFTTKSAGKGTGLGLAICHGIVTAHGGQISASSEPAGGATFTIRLPLAQAKPGRPDAP
jgi:PAS domain S-box-containing protein